MSKDYSFRFNNETELIMDIKPDGSVETYVEGAQQKAAQIFYKALQIEGKTLHQRIAELEKQLKEKQKPYQQIAEGLKAFAWTAKGERGLYAVADLLNSQNPKMKFTDDEVDLFLDALLAVCTEKGSE